MLPNKKNLTDRQLKIITEMILSGAAESLRKLNKTQLNGAKAAKLCKLIDLLPASAQWAFNSLHGLPEAERLELCALAVAVEKILHELVEIDQPYPLTNLISNQVRNVSLFPGSSAGVSGKISQILAAENMSFAILTFQGTKRMIEL